MNVTYNFDIENLTKTINKILKIPYIDNELVLNYSYTILLSEYIYILQNKIINTKNIDKKNITIDNAKYLFLIYPEYFNTLLEESNINKSIDDLFIHKNKNISKYLNIIFNRIYLKYIDKTINNNLSQRDFSNFISNNKKLISLFSIYILLYNINFEQDIRIDIRKINNPILYKSLYNLFNRISLGSYQASTIISLLKKLNNLIYKIDLNIKEKYDLLIILYILICMDLILR